MSAVAPADAAGVLYERHSRRIFGYCLSLLGSREDAEDAVQTTFVNAQRGLGRGVVPEFELAWLFRIARNVCYNARASSSRRGRHEGAVDIDALQDLLPAPERGSDGPSIDELTRALSDVPERQRRALLLREVRGLSYDEIAAELGVTVPAVETLIFRARRAVAEQLVQPGKRRRHGLLVPLSTLLRGLFQGGAAPAKLAAAAATLVLVAPAAQHSVSVHGITPARAVRGPAQAAPTVAPPALPPVRTLRTHRNHARVAQRRPAAAAKKVVPVTSTPQQAQDRQPVSAPSRQDARAVDTPPPAVQAPTPPAPTVPLPSVTVPAVPPLPVELPHVDLPVDTPALPALRKLP